MRFFRKLPRALYPANPHEQECLIKAMSCLKVERGMPETYDYEELLIQWKSFVKAVQRGYTLPLQDYTLTLTLRDDIEQMVETFPDRLKNAVCTFLEPLDGAFILSTREVARPLHPNAEGHTVTTRWYRVPRILLPDIEDSSWYGYA
jgi:hypothetical protein